MLLQALICFSVVLAEANSVLLLRFGTLQTNRSISIIFYFDENCVILIHNLFGSEMLLSVFKAFLG